MTHPLVIVGGGGHAKVVFDAAIAAGLVVEGFLDDHLDAPLRHLGVRHLGTMKDVRKCGDLARLVPAIGDNAQRRALMLEMIGGDDVERLATVIHPRAVISVHDVTIGPGTFIGPGAIINTGGRIGAGVIINSGAIVEHDVVIGDWAHIAPGADLAGAVCVETLALVGLGSRILPGRIIGAETIVGAGAVVTRDVEPQTTVRGNPAKEA